MIEPHKIFGRMANRMFQGAYIYTQMREGNIPDLFVQDYTLFEKYENEIKNLYGGGIGYLEFIAIHVRRGDYITKHSDFYVNVCETDYYKKAIEMFPGKKFLVFCKDGQGEEQDKLDKQWCIDYFLPLLGDRFQFMSTDDPIEDFNLMASCESIITANSTYSWWCAYLCPNFGKTIVTPKQWFKDGIERCKIPKTWIKL